MATVGEQIPISTHTIDKVTKAKVTLENYYTNLVSQNDERECRSRRLEKTMNQEGLTDEQKSERRQQHALKETEFLRLKRSRLGVDDFESLKVIGRGAFGETYEMKRGKRLPNFEKNRTEEYLKGTTKFIKRSAKSVEVAIAEEEEDP